MVWWDFFLHKEKWAQTEVNEPWQKSRKKDGLHIVLFTYYQTHISYSFGCSLPIKEWFVMMTIIIMTMIMITLKEKMQGVCCSALVGSNVWVGGLFSCFGLVSIFLEKWNEFHRWHEMLSSSSHPITKGNTTVSLIPTYQLACHYNERSLRVVDC